MTPELTRDFEMLHHAWARISSIFGSALYEVNSAIESQIWAEMFRLFKPYGGLRQRYITKAQRELLGKVFTLRITNLGRPFWVAFVPWERDDTKRPEMGFKAKRIVTVNTPRGLFHIFPFQMNHTVSVKGHAVRRLQERACVVSEAEAIAVFSEMFFRDIDLDPVAFSEEDIPRDIPVPRHGGVLKAIDVTVSYNVNDKEKDKFLHTMVHTYYPPSFMERNDARDSRPNI